MPSTASKCDLNYLVESTWDPRYLRAKCKELGLESEFNAYQIRLFRSYVIVFCVFHISITIIHCILISLLSEHDKYILFDVGIYAGSCTILILALSINFSEKLTERHPWIMFVSSALAVLILVSVDLTHSLYHYFSHAWQCGSFYDTYIVYMIYLFLPILRIKGAILLGSLVCIMYITVFAQVVFTGMQGKSSQGSMSLDIVHYICINLTGIYCRLINEMVVRTSFIDRHQFIREELCLRNAQRQEKLLLDSILPSQFSGPLQKDIKKRIILCTRLSSTPIRNFNVFRRSMAIQIHPDVSILYADVVNYTHLTTTLTVEKLVTTLHDLYGRFDVAAHHYKVQRIKFLGDCYYCVAGLADVDPDHANNAVSLGIAMITQMQEVRESQGLDINMRIGVHSGSLYAGVIGEAKLQYDVWGTDVTIANVLESTGVAGAVHISGSTMRNLTSRHFSVENGPEKAKHNPLLKKYKISTYLVSRPNVIYRVDSAMLDSREFLNTHRHQSISTLFNEELRNEYRNMPVIQLGIKTIYYRIMGKKRWINPLHKKINCFLTFYSTNLEKSYLKQTDYLFKYHMLLAWVVGNSLVYILTLNLSVHAYIYHITYAFVFLSLTTLTFIVWYKQICWMRYGKRNKLHSYNRVSCAIFRIHEKIQENLILRICTYLFVIFLYWVLIFSITVNCHFSEFILSYIEERIYHYETEEDTCFYPWVVTHSFALMIAVTFTFGHIPLQLKNAVAACHVLIYFIFIFSHFDFVFHHSITSNPYFPSEFAHAFLIITTFLIMFLKARQTEFGRKINFNWRVELDNKRNDAAITNRSIIILLNNILPNHVVDIYLSSLSHNELYYENYKMVSVMFAMLSNFEMDLSSLRILNEVITQFDVLLLYYKEYHMIEKIKIVNCTYMAACGLDVNFAGATSRPVRSDSLEKRVHPTLTFNQDREEVVFVMASFALDLMRTLASCNKAYNGIFREYNIIDGMITIGISSGEIMAGIVGASKPHYDIWGDPVNMAARMEMTGLAGRIQVTEESAIILKSFGIQCNYRGKTFVKGRGLLPTYFLGIDEDYNFIRVRESRTPTYAYRSMHLSMGSTYT